jgi:transposase
VVSRRWVTIIASSEPDSPQFVPLGDDGKYMVPDPLLSTGLAGEHEPTIRLSLVVVDGVPQCRRVEITATDGGREVRPSDVHSLHLEHVLEQIYRKVALAVHDGSGLDPSWSGTFGDEGIREVVRSARKGRPRKMTSALLAEVATVYRQHVTSTPTAEIARRFEVSDRTARLYVQRARQAGLLGGSIPGRAGETAKEDS